MKQTHVQGTNFHLDRVFFPMGGVYRSCFETHKTFEACWVDELGMLILLHLLTCPTTLKIKDETGPGLKVFSQMM